MANKYKTLGINTILMMVGTIGAKVINLIMLPFYTKWLNATQFGLADTVTIYATLLVCIVSLCIECGVFVYSKDKPIQDVKCYFSSGLFFLGVSSVIVALLFYLLGNNFSVWRTILPSEKVLWEILLLLLSNVFLVYVQQFTRSINKVLVYSITGILVTACTAFFAFLLIPKYNVDGYVLSFVLANFVAILFCFFLSKSFLFFSLRAFRLSALKEMLKYSMPLVPNAIMWWIVSSLNRPLLAENYGFREIGLYAVANKFPGFLTIVFSVFNSSWQISVLEEFGKKDYGKFYNNLFRFMVVSSSVILIFLTIFAKSIVKIFASAEFYDAWKYIPILSLGVLFLNVSGFVGANFSAVKKSKYYFYSSVWAAIVAIALNFLLIPKYGLWGATMSTMLSFGVMAVARIIYSWKYIHIMDVHFYVFLMLGNSVIYLLLLFANTELAVALGMLMAMFCGWHEWENCRKIFEKISHRGKNENS